MTPLLWEQAVDGSVFTRSLLSNLGGKSVWAAFHPSLCQKTRRCDQILSAFSENPAISSPTLRKFPQTFRKTTPLFGVFRVAHQEKKEYNGESWNPVSGTRLKPHCPSAKDTVRLKP
jgi:hypothetical protein